MSSDNKTAVVVECHGMTRGGWKGLRGGGRRGVPSNNLVVSRGECRECQVVLPHQVGDISIQQLKLSLYLKDAALEIRGKIMQQWQL